MTKRGRGYLPETEEPYKPRSYHLRYTQKGKRMGAVGNDLAFALEGQKARQQMLETSVEPSAPAAPPRKTPENTFLSCGQARRLNKDGTSPCRYVAVIPRRLL